MSSEAVRIVYFGCIGRVGHYWWHDDPNLSRIEPVGPWGQVDGRLTPKGDTTQGAAALHHKDGWTALAVHDYTVDKRGRSNSVFLADAVLDSDAMVAAITERVPKLVARIGPLRLVDDPCACGGPR